jgi:hypothetical protein
MRGSGTSTTSLARRQARNATTIKGRYSAIACRAWRKRPSALSTSSAATWVLSG